MTNAKKYGILCKANYFTASFWVYVMDIRFVRLFDIYAPLLSERQRDIMELYYNEDESLSEIAENTGITRQGVRDWIKKTEAQLDGYERALGLAERSDTLKAILSSALVALENGDAEGVKTDLKKAESLI